MDSSPTRKPDLKTEAIAGITTFFTMAYIVVVNPQILSADGKTGMVFSGVLTATVLVCFTMTLLMGVYAKLPFAVAPGMGINAFFTYTIILGKGVPWPTALGIIFWAGVYSLATMGAGLAGSSSGTAYIESIAGIRMGGRTGLTSVFTALGFLPDLDPDSPDLLDHPGNPVGLHLPPRTVLNGRASPRHLSDDVRAGADFDRVARAGAH